MNRQTRSRVTELLARHDLRPRKALGQHFLADPNLIAKVVNVADVSPGDRVLEVGAGTGALTAALAGAGARVVAYEVDQRLRPVLDETLAGLDIDLRFADAMDVDLGAELTRQGGAAEWSLVANLPYNVGTPLLLEILLSVPVVTRAVVMVQREVADRLVAAPGSADYGLPSVVVGLTATVTARFAVPPQVFVPAPQVDSSVVRLDRTGAPDALHAAVALARTAFGQRRKMLRRSLGLADDMFTAAGIDPATRPEDLTPEQFVALAQVVAGE